MTRKTWTITGFILALIIIVGVWVIVAHHHSAAPTKSIVTNKDTIKPGVRITVPVADLQAVKDTLKVSVDATDNRSVARVEYRIDDVFAGVSYSPPFSMALDVSTLKAGKHTLTVVAYDGAGNASPTQSIEFNIVAAGGSSNSTGSHSGGSSSTKSTGTTKTPTGGSGSSGSGAGSGGSSGSGGNNGGGGTPPPPTDATPPSAPNNVVASDPGTFFVHLSWSAATDNVGVSGYQIWRNNSLIATVTSASYDDHTSIPGGSYEYKVIASDAAGNTTAASPVSIDLAAATVFDSNDTPPASDSGDASSIEVGMKFRATQAGSITGVRFYKSTADTGTHVGDLWSSDGTNLARVTFTDESASGWQTATFASPVHITANTTYVISYLAPNGHYTGSSHYFQVPHATNSYLTGLQDGTDGGNDVFTETSTPAFPSSTFNAANYWVDATFKPDAAATFISKVDCPAYPSFPDAACTGALGGDTMAALSGAVILDNDNQVYSNLKVDGTIIVRGCGDTLRNVEVDAGEPFTDDSTPDLFAIWLQVPADCSTTLDHVSIITKDSPNDYVTTGIRVANGGPVTITNTRITGVQIGILTGPGTIQDSDIELGATMREDHNEDILEDGTSGLTINHNAFLNQNSQTSVLSLFTENGPNSDILIENNLLAGGGYTVYGGDGTEDGGGNPIAAPTNVDFINNVFWRKFFPDSGFFASGRDYNPAGGGQWTNNLYMNADGTLTAEQVPQPPLSSP